MLLSESRSKSFVVRLGLIALVVVVFIIHCNHDGVLSLSTSSFWKDKNHTTTTNNDSTANTVGHNGHQDGGDNDNRDDGGDKSNEIISRLLRQHPVCAKIILDDSSKEKRIDLRKLIKFVPVSQHNESMTTTTTTTTATTTTTSPSSPLRYDHLCRFMKARYNCAGASHDPPATHWKAVLTREEKRNDVEIDEYCDVRAFINDVGGPSGVGKLLFLSRNNNKTTKRNEKDDLVESQPPRFNVLLQGNSLLRQVFEAMGCGWSYQLTRARMMHGGISISLATLAAQNDTKISLYDDDGTSKKAEPIDLVPLSSPFHHNGSCHGISGRNIRKFYRQGMEPRDDIRDCSDNLAMLEFGEYLRMHFINRSRLYKNRTELYEFLQFDANDIDVLLHNSAESEREIEGRHQRHDDDDNDDALALIVKRYTLMDSGDKFLVDLQEQQIGKAYTADNPFTKGYNDRHPCLPGIPDDEANLVLFALLMGIEKFNL